MRGTAPPLQLLFDLTFATSFGLAASEAAAVLAQGHFVAGLVGFGFASFRHSLGLDQLQAVFFGLTTPTTGCSGSSPWCR